MKKLLTLLLITIISDNAVAASETFDNEANNSDRTRIVEALAALPAALPADERAAIASRANQFISDNTDSTTRASIIENLVDVPPLKFEAMAIISALFVTTDEKERNRLQERLKKLQNWQERKAIILWRMAENPY